MEDQINKKRKRAIVKALVWTVFALFVMFFCIGSFYESSFQDKKEAHKQAIEEVRDTLHSYKNDTIPKYKKEIDTLKYFQNENGALENESKIKVFFEKKFENISLDIDNIYSSNSELIDLIVKGESFNHKERKLDKHEVVATNKLDTLEMYLDGRSEFPDSTIISETIWSSTYSSLINNKRDLIKSILYQNELSKNCPDNLKFDCKKCIENSCPQFQEASSVAAAKDCSELEEKILSKKEELKKNKDAKLLIKEDLNKLLSKKNVQKKHINAILNNTEYWQ